MDSNVNKKTTIFDFDTTEIDLTKYDTKSITHPKIQEKTKTVNSVLGKNIKIKKRIRTLDQKIPIYLSTNL